MTTQNKSESCKRVRGAPLSIWTIAILAMCCASGVRALAQRSAAGTSQGPVRVQLFDVYSGLAIANTLVEVTSDNGIRYSVPPCPTNGQTWSGQTDASGSLMIPRSAIQFNNDVKTKDHRGVVLGEDVINDPSGTTHQIELYSQWLFEEQHDWTRGYKLVDARSGKTLANASAHIEFPPNDWPAQHGGITRLDVKTNPRGYVSFSFLRKPEPKQGQTLPDAPLADWMTPEVWVAVPGYSKAKLNYFDGSDDGRSNVQLQHQ